MEKKKKNLKKRIYTPYPKHHVVHEHVLHVASLQVDPGHDGAAEDGGAQVRPAEVRPLQVETLPLVHLCTFTHTSPRLSLFYVFLFSFLFPKLKTSKRQHVSHTRSKGQVVKTPVDECMHSPVIVPSCSPSYSRQRDRTQPPPHLGTKEKEKKRKKIDGGFGCSFRIGLHTRNDAQQSTGKPRE